MATELKPPRRMTVEEFLALPDDGVDRWLIDGELRENGMTVRNWAHSRVLIRIGRFLDAWNDARTKNRGLVIGGEAGFRLKGAEDSAVGVDVAYISGEMAAKREGESSLIVGAPILAVEILSPSDTQKILLEKLTKYLDAGVQAVWWVEPELKTVRVFEPGRPPQQFAEGQTLTGGDYLPGFSVPVAELFA